MSLFQERQASAKKVIHLQNEIFSLKQQLEKLPAQFCEDCKKLKDEIESLLSINQTTLQKEADSATELAGLKAELKKTRAENTRLKNKIAALEAQPDVQL
jgi:hypothetical protein